MKKLNKKGFTLVEILAVTVILVVIILLATNAFFPLTKKAKKKAFISEIETYVKGAEAYYQIKDLNSSLEECEIIDGDLVCSIDINSLEGEFVKKTDVKNEYNGCVSFKVEGTNVYDKKVSMSNGAFKYTGQASNIKDEDVLIDTTEASCEDFINQGSNEEEKENIYDNVDEVTLIARESGTSKENFYAYATKIIEIELVNHTNHGVDTIDCDDDKDMKWCVAQADEKKGIKRDAIIAWFEKSEIDTSKYKLYIGSEKKIYAPEDSSYLFGNLNWLKKIKFSNFDTSKVENMTGMFWACSDLTGIDLKNFDTSNVTNMNSMFYWCIELTSLDLSSFNVRKVENMYQMFRECSSLKSITFGNNFVTSSVIYMSAMFLNCQSLTTLDLSSFDTSNVRNMNSMFYGCGGLINLYLSNFNTKNVENMGQMFFDCSSLTSITFGDNFDTSKVTNKIDMFSYCKSLTKIYLNNEEERTRLSSLKPASAKYYNY